MQATAVTPEAPISAASTPIIDARDITKRYGDGKATKVAVDGVSLQVARGDFLAIVGPSGCGKSTLLGILGCLDRSFEGRLSLFGADVRAMRDADLAGLRGGKIGFVFQAFHLLGHVNARDNVLAPLLFLREASDAARMRKRADDLLAEVGLGGRGDEMPSTLSGGERQRLAVARALLLEPELLLCDEPTGNLDLATGRSVTELFGRLHRERGLTLVAVTHEEQLAEAATSIVRLSAGRVVEANTTVEAEVAVGDGATAADGEAGAGSVADDVGAAAAGGEGG
ncbi:MAG: ABC transporter ATP-binding protein [Bacteroidota bacterium]